MYSSLKLKLLRSIPFPLLLIVSLALYSSTHLITRAANSSSPKSGQLNIAHTSSCGAWSVIPSPSPGLFNNYLYSVAVVSTNNAWAVGHTETQTLIEHWNGTKWRQVSSPSPGTGSNILSGISAISANNIWVVGNSAVNGGFPKTLVEHWNGTKWSVVKSPNFGTGSNDLESVTAISSNDVWAVGSGALNTYSSRQTLITHWDGTSWSIISSPNVVNLSNSLSSITGVSSNNVWAVGASSNVALIEHWDGIQWSIVPSPNPTSFSMLQGTTHVPGTNTIWAVGLYQISSGATRTLTELYC